MALRALQQAGQLLLVHTAADVEKCRGDGGCRRHRCRAVGRAAAEALARAAGGRAVADRHPAGSVHDEPRGRAREDGLQLVKGRALWSGSKLRVAAKVGARDGYSPLAFSLPGVRSPSTRPWHFGVWLQPGGTPSRRGSTTCCCGAWRRAPVGRALSCASRGLTTHRKKVLIADQMWP